MTYEKVRWLHDSSNEPVLIFSELDAERWELRKVEAYPDGSMLYADETTPLDARTILSEHVMPTLNEITADPQFVGEYIDAEAFEQAWNAARAGLRWNL